MVEICKFFKGENPIPTDEDNYNCGIDCGNCDNPLNPCMVRFVEDDEYKLGV